MFYSSTGKRNSDASHSLHLITACARLTTVCVLLYCTYNVVYLFAE